MKYAISQTNCFSKIRVTRFVTATLSIIVCKGYGLDLFILKINENLFGYIPRKFAFSQAG